MNITGERGAEKSRLKKCLEILLAILIALVGIGGVSAIHHPGHMDFISYWSSGELIAHHLDPYSPEKVMALEKSAGAAYSNPLMMRNPPWALFLVAPLGFLSIYTGLFLWLVIIIACTLGSVLLLYRDSKYGPVALLFAPILICINSGQSAGFLLLGFSLFLYLQRSRPFLAGASLLLMAIKPHLFLVFWAVLLVDCVYQRRYRILVGAASALAAASALSMCFDPRIWKHYIEMMFSSQIQEEPLPTVSMLFRWIIDVRLFWLIFVPSIIAILWGLWYYVRRRDIWDWRVHGMLLMIVTILASPYGWMTDQAVLLPCVLFALTLPKTGKYSGWILLGINAAILILALGSGKSLASFAYVWTPVAWLLWFLYSTNAFRQRGRNLGPLTPDRLLQEPVTE